MFRQEKAQTNLVNRKMWSTRLMVEQWQREVHPVRAQQQQPREKEIDAAVWWEPENRNSSKRWALMRNRPEKLMRREK